MIEILKTIVEICSSISVVFTALLLFVRPLRNKIFNDEKQRNGMKCLLRGQMLHAYYTNKDNEAIRQYEYENFIACYEAYKALGGNSFIEHIAKEVFKWEVIT